MPKSSRSAHLWDYNFFGSVRERELRGIFGISESRLLKCYDNVLYLVKWGFSREEAWLMPMPELQSHIDGINAYYNRKAKSQTASETGKNDKIPKYAGNSLPGSVVL